MTWPAAALLAAALAAAGAKTPVEREFYDAAVQYGAEVGTYAYTIGTCEAYLAKGDADRAVADITGAGDPGAGDIARSLHQVWSSMYAKGRLAAAEEPMTSEACRLVLSETVSRMKPAATRFSAAMKAFEAETTNRPGKQ